MINKIERLNEVIDLLMNHIVFVWCEKNIRHSKQEQTERRGLWLLRMLRTAYWVLTIHMTSWEMVGFPSETKRYVCYDNNNIHHTLNNLSLCIHFGRIYNSPSAGAGDGITIAHEPTICRETSCASHIILMQAKNFYLFGAI